MKITNVNLTVQAVRRSQYPEVDLPEFMLVGRSNVGKSSFINTLVNRKNIAYTSGKPGKTQTLNFYLVNDNFYLVDVPGYGYASVNKKVQEKFGKMIEEYLEKRDELIRVFMLVDFRHKPTEDDKLILGKMTAKEALNKGVRDAVTFGPFLIVNGKPSFIKGNGGWGTAPRSAIGQRKDGIVLFLVIDGRMVGRPGADMVDLTEIMQNYGAYNAANLDGGTSCGLVVNGELINDPVNGNGKHKTRMIATGFIVKE